MKLDPDFREFIDCCIGADVRYLVIGGYAVVHYGHVRLTKNLDLRFERTVDHASRLMTALSRFGFNSIEHSTAELTNQDVLFRIGHPPRQVDLINSPPGLEFGVRWDRRETVGVDGTPVMVVGRDDLLILKRASGRPRDLADIDEPTPRGGDDTWPPTPR